MCVRVCVFVLFGGFFFSTDVSSLHLLYTIHQMKCQSENYWTGCKVCLCLSTFPSKSHIYNNREKTVGDTTWRSESWIHGQKSIESPQSNWDTMEKKWTENKNMECVITVSCIYFKAWALACYNIITHARERTTATDGFMCEWTLIGNRHENKGLSTHKFDGDIFMNN